MDSEEPRGVVSRRHFASGWQIGLLTAYVLAQDIVGLYVLVALGPDLLEAASEPAGTTGEEVAAVTIALFGVSWTATPEALSFLVVLASGIVGGGLRSTISLVSYVGNRTLRSSWILWYIIDPVLSAGVALLIYLAIRGGLLNINASSTDLNPYAVIAVAIASGLMSRLILDWLKAWADRKLVHPPSSWGLDSEPGPGEDDRKTLRAP